jgi:hypothetical protein
MSQLPDHIREELHKLIDEKMAPEQIAFLMRLDLATVREEIAACNTTAPADRAAE